MTSRHDADLDRLAPLAEPVRRRIYDFVAESPAPVDRDTVAAGAGIGRPLAAFHLDRLAAAGLLETEYRRRTGRTGPGAGRPAKFYRLPTAADVAVSLPPRQYDLAAEIFANGIERRPAALAGVLDAARERGAEMAADSPVSDRASLVALLRSNGYAPFADDDGTIRLRNCPFHALVADHRELTCSMNLALLTAATSGEAAGRDAATGGLHAFADPRDGLCCVAFRED